MRKYLREGGRGAEVEEAQQAVLLQHRVGCAGGPEECILREGGYQVWGATAGLELGESAAGRGSDGTK